jgi:hypothetical protein
VRTNLATEISKPIRSHKQSVHAQEAIESAISMIEMAVGLSFQAEDSMIANNFVTALSWLMRECSQGLYIRIRVIIRDPRRSKIQGKATMSPPIGETHASYVLLKS